MLKDLTVGKEWKALITFALPMIFTNIFQQLYNIIDAIVVGKYIGAKAIAAVGSSYTLLVFIYSIIIGLCMGCGVVFSYYFGGNNQTDLKKSFTISFWSITGISLLLNLLVLLYIEEILFYLRIPQEIWTDTRAYLTIIFYGVTFTSLFHYFAAGLRSLGNSKLPLQILVVGLVLNIVLDLVFVIQMGWGITGVAWATFLAQACTGLILAYYCWKNIAVMGLMNLRKAWDFLIFKALLLQGVLSSLQQSVMNFGILTIQGLINSFGVVVMAGFATAVKIDSLAYMPVQDFGNAFTTFVAQNKGAGQSGRIHKGFKLSLLYVTIFCFAISALVLYNAEFLLKIFIEEKELAVLAVGKSYLQVVAGFYCLIGYLFVFYGFYRGLACTSMSLLLTILSLGTRVALAFYLVTLPQFGLNGIWWSIPIGWLLADIVGMGIYWYYGDKLVGTKL